ncbi:hypothetical protein HDU92_008712 [Lobulomyces angularis]|nr:hypothetical protein HDU92_008712 [Lobulomyces angularis]
MKIIIVLLSCFSITTSWCLKDPTSISRYSSADTVKIDNLGWASAIAVNKVLKIIIEEQLNYKATFVDNEDPHHDDPLHNWYGLSNGTVDVTIETWLQTKVRQDILKHYSTGISRTIENAGPIGYLGTTGVFVSRFILDQIPAANIWLGLKDPDICKYFAINQKVADFLNENNPPDTPDEAFDIRTNQNFSTVWTETASKNLGLMLQVTPKYGGDGSRGLIESLGLCLEQQHSFNDALFVTIIEKLTSDLNIPVIIPFWQPDSLLQRGNYFKNPQLDFTKVTLPSSSGKNCVTGANQNCEIDDTVLQKLISRNLEPRLPEVYWFLREFSFSLQDVNYLLTEIDLGGSSAEDAACSWIKQNEEKWRNWLWMRNCESNCSGHGICYMNTCKCDKHFEGSLCEITNTCSKNGVFDIASEKCHCNSGFYGPKCADSIVLPIVFSTFFVAVFTLLYIFRKKVRRFLSGNINGNEMITDDGELVKKREMLDAVWKQRLFLEIFVIFVSCLTNIVSTIFEWIAFMVAVEQRHKYVEFYSKNEDKLAKIDINTVTNLALDMESITIPNLLLVYLTFTIISSIFVLFVLQEKSRLAYQLISQLTKGADMGKLLADHGMEQDIGEEVEDQPTSSQSSPKIGSVFGQGEDSSSPGGAVPPLPSNPSSQSISSMPVVDPSNKKQAAGIQKLLYLKRQILYKSLEAFSLFLYQIPFLVIKFYILITFLQIPDIKVSVEVIIKLSLDLSYSFFHLAILSSLPKVYLNLRTTAKLVMYDLKKIDYNSKLKKGKLREMVNNSKKPSLKAGERERGSIV